MSIFRKDENLFFWGPINGQSIYVSYFMDSIARRTHKIYKYKWPKFIFAFIGHKMTFVCNNDELVKQGKKYFKEWIIDNAKFEKAKKIYRASVQNLEKVESKIKNLEKLEEEDFQKLYFNFEEKYLTFWDHGLVPEIANWGGEVILKENLKTIPAQNFLTVYEKLSAPAGLSFYQKEELELLQIKSKKSLTQHTKKYFWLNNSYLDSTNLSDNFFKNRLAELSAKEKKEKINKIKNFIQKSEKEKRKIFQQYKLPKETQKISERLSYCIYWQDERKENIFKANHYIKLFLKEFSRRYKIPFSYLEKTWCWEISNLLEGRKVNKKIMTSRLEKQAGFMDAQKEKNSIITAKEFEDKIRPILDIKINQKIEEIKGLSVNIGQGKIKGKVRILLDPRDSNKMKKGEVLLAPMTSPEYILAMRKASAVITDTGGMTCHAAIVSRELGIPCIVGTKIATRIFKDGQLVEVDAKRGLVKLLK